MTQAMRKHSNISKLRILSRCFPVETVAIQHVFIFGSGADGTTRMPGSKLDGFGTGNEPCFLRKPWIAQGKLTKMWKNHGHDLLSWEIPHRTVGLRGTWVQRTFSYLLIFSGRTGVPCRFQEGMVIVNAIFPFECNTSACFPRIHYIYPVRAGNIWQHHFFASAQLLHGLTILNLKAPLDSSTQHSVHHDVWLLSQKVTKELINQPSNYTGGSIVMGVPP